MINRKRTKRQTIIHKEIQRKLKIEQHESDDYLGVNSGAPEGKQLAILNCFGGDYTRKYI
jgi:hypothetical protein